MFYCEIMTGKKRGRKNWFGEGRKDLLFQKLLHNLKEKTKFLFYRPKIAKDENFIL